MRMLLAGLVAVCMATDPEKQTVIQYGDNKIQKQANQSSSELKASPVERKLLKAMAIPITEAPYVVIYGKYNGAIIYPGWVLTAAICTKHKSIRLILDCKSNYTAKFIKTKSASVMFGDGQVVWIDRHLSYYKYGLQLLQLRKNIIFDEFAAAIPIGDPSLIQIGSEVKMVGWGAVESMPNLKYSDNLMTVSLPIINCVRRYNYTFKYFCTNSEKGGPTNGYFDSSALGAPVTINGFLVGTLHWTYKDLKEAITNIPNYKNVILKLIGSKQKGRR